MDVVVCLYDLPDLIITNKSLFFISKSWSLLCYFLSIKQKLFTIFYPQTNSQIEWQNSTIETYLQAFVNFKQNNWAKLLLMTEFAYNNAKNANIGHTSFKLNCGHYSYVSFDKNINPCPQSKTANKLSTKLLELITIYQENLYHAQKL